MDENEIMTVENEEVSTENGIGTGMAMLIGGLLAAGIITGGKQLKKMIDKRKNDKKIVEAECKTVFESDDVEPMEEDE
jgi:hypothetical protein